MAAASLIAEQARIDLLASSAGLSKRARDVLTTLVFSSESLATIATHLGIKLGMPGIVGRGVRRVLTLGHQLAREAAT